MRSLKHLTKYQTKIGRELGYGKAEMDLKLLPSKKMTRRFSHPNTFPLILEKRKRTAQFATLVKLVTNEEGNIDEVVLVKQKNI